MTRTSADSSTVSSANVGAGRHPGPVTDQPLEPVEPMAFGPESPASPSIEVIPLGRDLAVWIATHPEFVDRYRAKVCPTPLGPHGCRFWLGGLNGDTGHAKVHVRHEHNRTAAGDPIHSEWLVYGHHIAWILAGRDLVPGEVQRHTCDEASCQNADHLIAGSPSDNLTDWHRRKFRWEGPLNDPRGAFGRAKAIREAILAAGEDPADQARAYREASAAGWRSIGQLTLLPADQLARLPD